MEPKHIDITIFQTLGLKQDASLGDIKEAYLKLTSQDKFMKVILEDEYLEKEFKRYHEAYATLLRHYSEATAGTDTRYYPPEQMALFQFNSGVYHMIGGNFIKAGQKLEQGIRINKKDALSHIYMGILLMKRKNLYAAEKYFQEALKIDPQNEDAWLYLGDNYFKAGNYSKAREMFEKVKAVNPTRNNLTSRIVAIREKLGIGPGERQTLGQKLAGLFKK